MDLRKRMFCNVGIPKLKKTKVWQSWRNSRLEWLKCALYLILSIGMPYYQEGCNIDYLTRSKVLIDNSWEDPERKPLRTNIEILEWSSLDLMDQMESCKQGFGLLWPGPVWPVRGQWLVYLNRPVWPVYTDRATASFWDWGIYTPQPSPLRAAGSWHSFELLEVFSWPASSPQHPLWVVLTRLHIPWLGWEIERV